MATTSLHLPVEKVHSKVSLTNANYRENCSLAVHRGADITQYFSNPSKIASFEERLL